MAAHLRGAEEQQLRAVIETLRAECGTGPRGSYKFRAIVKGVAAQLRALSDSPVRTASDIGSVKQPMPADLRGLHARFPPVQFCLAICGLRVVSGHIERDPLVFTIARGRAVAELIEAFATADELASESSAWRSNARRAKDSAAAPGVGANSARRSAAGSGPESGRNGAAAGQLEVTERDLVDWFDLLVADEERLDALGAPPPADGERGTAAVLAWREKAAAAQNTLLFPAAMAQRFVALRLYTTAGQSAASIQREDWAVLSSLALMTAALRAHAAATNGESAAPGFENSSPGRVAVGLVAHRGTRSEGPTLFGERLAALPLSLIQLERWGADMRSHAPTAAALGALFLAVVLHGLSHVEHAPMQPTSAESLHSSGVDAAVSSSNEPMPSLVVLGNWLESTVGNKAAGLDRLSAHYRTLLVDGFKTGFSLSQAVQGEAAAAAALPMVSFLQQHGGRASALFLDHYIVALSSAPAEHSGGGRSGEAGALRSSCGSMDGYSYPLYARFIDRLSRLAETDTGNGGPVGIEPPPEIAVSQVYRDYQSYRLGLCIHEPKQHPGLGKLVAQLVPIPGVSKFLQAEAVATAVGRTLQMSHAVTRSAGGPMIAAWSQAVACFGAETMRTLVTELNKTGLPAQQLQQPKASSSSSSPSVSTASSRAIILEFAPAALHAAVQGRQWASEVPAILAMMAWVFAETRQWLQGQSQSSSDPAGDTQTPPPPSPSPQHQQRRQMTYKVNLQSFALREHPASASTPRAPSQPSAPGTVAFSWGGARGWMAELNAIAAQKRRGDHVELSEERQRRTDAVVTSLKLRLTPVEKGLGGLLHLKTAQGVLLTKPPEDLPTQETGETAVSAEFPERVGGQPRQRSPSEIELGSPGKPDGRIGGSGKNPRRSEGGTTMARSSAPNSRGRGADSGGLQFSQGGGDGGLDAATLSAERQYRSDLERRVRQLEDELAETKALLRKREQEGVNYRAYNVKLLAHNTNLRTAMRQQTLPGFESKSSGDVRDTASESNTCTSASPEVGATATVDETNAVRRLKEEKAAADGIMRAHAAAELADTRDRASRIFMLYQESGLGVRDFLELTLSSIQPGGGGGSGRRSGGGGGGSV